MSGSSSQFQAKGKERGAKGKEQGAKKVVRCQVTVVRGKRRAKGKGKTSCQRADVSRQIRAKAGGKERGAGSGEQRAGSKTSYQVSGFSRQFQAKD